MYMSILLTCVEWFVVRGYIMQKLHYGHLTEICYLNTHSATSNQYLIHIYTQHINFNLAFNIQHLPTTLSPTYVHSTIETYHKYLTTTRMQINKKAITGRSDAYQIYNKQLLQMFDDTFLFPRLS